MKILLHLNERNLIMYLSSKDGWVTAHELADRLMISVRTVRYYINHINGILKPEGISIISKNGCGYQIEYGNDKKSVLNSIIFPSDNFHTREDRVAYLLPNVISSDMGLNKYDLENEMFVSRSTLEGDIARMVDEYENNAPFLKIINKGNILRVDDNEWKKRIAICKLMSKGSNYKYYFQGINGLNYLSGFDISENIRSLKCSLARFNYRYNMPKTIEAVLYIAVSKRRITEGRNLKEFDFDDIQIDGGISEVVDDFFENERPDVGKVFTDVEKKYVAFYLSIGRSGFRTNEELAYIRETASQDIYPYVKEAMESIDRLFEVRLAQDEVLRARICSQIYVSFTRLKFLWERDASLLSEIINRHPATMDMACIIVNKVMPMFRQKFHENEISYIAAKLSEYLYKDELLGEKSDIAEKRKIPVAIIGSGGIGRNLYLGSNVLSMFGSIIKLVGYYSPFEIDICIEEKKPRIIITGGKIPEEKLQGALIQHMQMPLNPEFFAQLASKIALISQNMIPVRPDENLLAAFSDELFFVNMKFRTLEDGIEFLCEKMELTGYTDPHFTYTVKNRNDMSPTIFGNGIALPHQLYPTAKKNGIAVAILKKPLIINRKPIHCIMIPAFIKNNRQHMALLWNLLIPLSDRKSMFKCYENINSLETFISLLSEPTD